MNDACCFESHIRNEVQNTTFFTAKIFKQTWDEFINIIILGMKK